MQLILLKDRESQRVFWEKKSRLAEGPNQKLVMELLEDQPLFWSNTVLWTVHEYVLQKKQFLKRQKFDREWISDGILFWTDLQSMGGRELREKRGLGGGGGVYGLPDVFTTFPYSFLTVALLAAWEVKLSKGCEHAFCQKWRIRIWTTHSFSSHLKWRIRIWTIHAYTPVHHSTMSKEYVSEQYINFCSSHQGVKDTYPSNTCTPVHHTRSDEYVSEQYMHSCSSHQEWRVFTVSVWAYKIAALPQTKMTSKDDI